MSGSKTCVGDRRILVVDDDEILLAGAKALLERNGYSVGLAIHGNEALQAMSERPADLVILDIIMPEKEGIETLIQLKEQYPTTKVIAITGGGRRRLDDFLKVAEHFGADVALKKPLQMNGLLDHISRLLSPEPAAAKEN